MPWRCKTTSADGAPLLAPKPVADETYEVLDWIGADMPAALPEEWKGPASPCGRRKLTSLQATEIRRRHAAGETLLSLADEFHVSRWSIRLIVEGRTYRDSYAPPDASPSPPNEILPPQ